MHKTSQMLNLYSFCGAICKTKDFEFSICMYLLYEKGFNSLGSNHFENGSYRISEFQVPIAVCSNLLVIVISYRQRKKRKKRQLLY